MWSQRTHTHTYPTLQPPMLGTVSPGRSLALQLLLRRHTAWALPLVPHDRDCLQGWYLEGDGEGLEMTLQIIPRNEVGRVHRLAVHKGGWRHDSGRETTTSIIPTPGHTTHGHTQPENPNSCLQDPAVPSACRQSLSFRSCYFSLL